jgi:hypothetical protein
MEKDLTPSSVHTPTAKTFKAILGTAPLFRIAKVDETLGVVFGWAIVCTRDGADYYDWNVDAAGVHKGGLVPEHITESAMLKSAADFMASARAGNEMHTGSDVGTFLFAFPLTAEIADAMGIASDKTGLMVGYQAPPAVLAKFRDGTYTGFSIEGKRIQFQEHD